MNFNHLLDRPVPVIHSNSRSKPALGTSDPKGYMRQLNREIPPEKKPYQVLRGNSKNKRIEKNVRFIAASLSKIPPKTQHNTVRPCFKENVQKTFEKFREQQNNTNNRSPNSKLPDKGPRFMQGLDRNQNKKPWVNSNRDPIQAPKRTDVKMFHPQY